MNRLESLFQKFSKMSPNEFLHTIMLEKKLPSKKAVADYLGLTKTRISAWSRDGKVPEKHVRRFAMELVEDSNTTTQPTEIKQDDNVVKPLLDKIEELTSEVNEYKRAQETINMHEASWPHHASIIFKYRINNFKMFRCVESIENMNNIVKFSGYTKAEILEKCDVGVEYVNTEHPIFGFIKSESTVTVSNMVSNMWGIFKQKDGLFTVPLELELVTKKGEFVTTQTKNTISLKEKFLHTKLRFEIKDK
jgi:hypothetical protein